MSGPDDITVDEDGIHGTFHYRFGLSHLGTRDVTISTGRHQPVMVNRIPVAAHLEFVEHHDGTWQPNGRSSLWRAPNHGSVTDAATRKLHRWATIQAARLAEQHHDRVDQEIIDHFTGSVAASTKALDAHLEQMNIIEAFRHVALAIANQTATLERPTAGLTVSYHGADRNDTYHLASATHAPVLFLVRHHGCLVGVIVPGLHRQPFAVPAGHISEARRDGAITDLPD
jgi:hypothetical protein